MKKKITQEQFDALAKSFNFDPLKIRAFVNVESSGSGFDTKGRLKIQFEPHRFLKYANVSIPNGVEGSEAENNAFEAALKINRRAALKSTSMGLMQIMGDEHKKAGYATVEQMYNEFCISEFFHVKAGFNFIINKKGLAEAIRSWDLPRVGWLYNGENYEKAIAKYKAEKAAGKNPRLPYADKITIEYNRLLSL